MVRGTVFSSGGFPARYGNALSAVLAMDTQLLPPAHLYTVGLGLAAASLGANVPIIPGKLGIRFTGNRSNTSAMFRLNGQRNQFRTTPRSYDGNLSLIYQYSPGGRVKLFNFTTADRLGVLVPEPSFDGVYRGESETWFHNLLWSDVFGSWFVRTSASANRYTARRQLGNLDLKPGDDTYKFRTDAERAIGRNSRVSGGVEIERTRSRLRGTVPALRGVLNPQADKLHLAQYSAATRLGLYGETEFRPARRILLLVGLRTDHHMLSGHTIADPRISARYLISRNSRIRLAWGLYHQFPLPNQYKAAIPEAPLKPQRALHLIAGWHYEQGALTLRLEAYHKKYRNLTLATGESTYLSTSGGQARGLDLFVKYGKYLENRFDGWISYSLLDSKRCQLRQMGYGYALEQGPSPYDLTHNITVVGKTRIVGYLYGSLTFRHATGRPITPIVESVRAAGGTYYLPVEGPSGSERLPDFRRLDVAANYFIPLNAHNAVIYVSVGNLLNRANVLNYDYSQDYTSRSERATRYRRFVYFGAVFNFSP